MLNLKLPKWPKMTKTTVWNLLKWPIISKNRIEIDKNHQKWQHHLTDLDVVGKKRQKPKWSRWIARSNKMASSKKKWPKSDQNGQKWQIYMRSWQHWSFVVQFCHGYGFVCLLRASFDKDLGHKFQCQCHMFGCHPIKADNDRHLRN